MKLHHTSKDGIIGMRLPCTAVLIRFLWLLLFGFSTQAVAHPMDMGSLQVELIEGSRMSVSLKLHALAAAKFANLPSMPSADADLATLGATLFDATLGQSAPRLGGDLCEWRKPELKFADEERQYLQLHAIAVCLQARLEPFNLDYPLPFLRNAPPKFELAAIIKEGGSPTTLLATAERPLLTIGEETNKSFDGFLMLGMGHIGALPGEWISSGGSFQLPEGLDHICFVLALIVAGGSFIGLLKNVTGFTIGHSLTLGLSAFKIIHIHSNWVEAVIALSIAYVAGAALIRPQSPHHGFVAALFGTVHGLGFASVLQELEMPTAQLIPALLGFNIGVELGQVVIIALTLPLLALLRVKSPGTANWANRTLAAGLFLAGSFWFLERIMGA